MHFSDQVYQANWKIKGWMDYLLENDKKEAQIQRQVKQVADEFQVKGVDRFSFPLSFHKHVTNIEYIFYKGWHSCCCQYHVPEGQRCKNWYDEKLLQVEDSKMT